MSIEWSRELETGNGVIDGQHRELIDRYNGFLSSLKEGKGKAEVGRILGFLEEYTDTHFSAEERLMDSSGYSGLADHRKLHDNFRQTLRVFRNEFEREGAGLALTLKANHLIGDWLRDHIMSKDKEMISSLKR